MNTKSSELAKAGKFAVVGVMNTLIDFGVFLLLSSAFGVNVYLSQAAGYSCGVLNSYIWNRSWTFRHEGKFFSPALIKFLVLNLSMLALSTGCLALFLHLGLHKIIAKGLTVAVTMVISFVVNRLWVFRTSTDHA